MSDQTGAPTPPSSPPPGWYPDPAGTSGQRYWDGQAWTDNLQAAATPPPPPVTPPPAPVAAPVPPSYTPAGSYAPTPSSYGAMPPGYAAPAARSIGFGEAIKRALSRWTNYSDRATVAEYWWFYLFAIIAMIPVYILAVVLMAAGAKTETDVNGLTTVSSAGPGLAIGILILVVAAIVLFFITLPLSVRRLHDGDRSGWWLLLGFIPFGSLVLLIFYILPGTQGPNRYGPPVA